MSLIAKFMSISPFLFQGLQKDIKEWELKKEKTNAEPNFIIVRQRKKRIVVVLDVSGSMAFRMTKARQVRYTF